MSKINLPNSTIAVAKKLLGYQLHSQINGVLTSGIIVETEAYLVNDPASHSFRGLTKSNAAMFGLAGTTYVYQIYGLHFCLNVVTNKQGCGEAVLIRALLPTVGFSVMQERRRQKGLTNLTNGPAKLTEALAIDKQFNNHHLTKKPLWLTRPRRRPPASTIVEAPRVGISQAKEQKWNFSLMPRERLYQVTTNIPLGKVATYQLLANLVGLKSPRTVGIYLHQNPDPKNIPCHRVVNSEGKLAKNFAFGGLEEQRKRLIKEKMAVVGEQVDLNLSLWTN